MSYFLTRLSIVGYQTAYSQLAFAGKKESDFLTETVPQLKMGLAKHLEKMSAAHPGKVGVLLHKARPTVYSRTSMAQIPLEP